METLIAMLVEKTGMSEAMASQAAEIALTFVKGQLPDSVSGMVDSAIGGEGAEAGGAASMVTGALGSLFGGGDD